ncbi:glycosyltransferase 87 family protein [Dietzia sp. PP-33]|jgi:alpha-1,2-mannosyltransferase|uniref:glycosyltransferase 87 family protein n=1 Tax=Dietzia sp. PP-33 TaxID=2957500 RepID=UPI0029B7A98A|nr:glycosyltransferase 87 family protein [Dietzia sp. PP-33]MDX2358625.1 glycosyltransferase 87 family protein [Dietzia sp. PP-33]
MRRPPTTARTVSLAAGLVLSAVVTVVFMVQAVLGFMLDLQVFQDAGRALLSGQDLYSEDFPTRSGFRFIYPPFAAIAFIPLAPLGPLLAQIAWTAATIAATWAILAMAATRLQLGGAKTVALALTGVALILEPIRANLGFGQINVFLFLIVTADVLGFTPRRVRGVLVGLAAGIKITPAAFALMYLVRRDWASLARAVATVIGTVALGHLVRPAASRYFWTTEFFLTDRGGPPGFVPNQALSGLLSRAEVSSSALDPAVYGFFLLVAVAATWGSWRLARDGRSVDALLLISLGVFIATPVAVTHHWSGMLIALPLLLAARALPVRLALAALVLAHLIGTHHAYSLTALDPAAGLLQWLIGNAQGLTGIAAFLVLLADSARPPRPDKNRPRGPRCAIPN